MHVGASTNRAADVRETDDGRKMELGLRLFRLVRSIFSEFNILIKFMHFPMIFSRTRPGRNFVRSAPREMDNCTAGNDESGYVSDKAGFSVLFVVGMY